jgi:hypothetical protein
LAVSFKPHPIITIKSLESYKRFFFHKRFESVTTLSSARILCHKGDADCRPRLQYMDIKFQITNISYSGR